MYVLSVVLSTKALNKESQNIGIFIYGTIFYVFAIEDNVKIRATVMLPNIIHIQNGNNENNKLLSTNFTEYPIT